MPYEWEDDLMPHVSGEKTKKLSEIVGRRIKEGAIRKLLYITGNLLLVILIFLFAIKILPMKDMKSRIAVINGLVAFELAVFTFIGPIRTCSITSKEVSDVLGIAVTTDIMIKIRKSVTKNTPNINKWFAFIGACALAVALIIGNCN